MVVKKIIQNCKKTKCIMLFEQPENDLQWIGDGYSLYPLYQMPKFDSETLCRAYDISEKQRNNIAFRHEDSLPTAFCYKDIENGEHICDPIQMSLIHDGAIVQPYLTSQGIKFLNQRYMQPCDDEGEMFLEVYERFTKDGQMYFAIKSGMMLLAIIPPMKIVSKKFVDTLQDLYVRSKVILESEEEPNA